MVVLKKLSSLEELGSRLAIPTRKRVAGRKRARIEREKERTGEQEGGRGGTSASFTCISSWSTILRQFPSHNF